MTLSDHFDGRRFFSPGVDTDKSLRDLWAWRRGRRAAPWPRQVALLPHPPPPQDVPAGEMLLTPVGHSTVLIQFQGCNVLTDPVFSDRASPLSWLGPKRVRAPGVAFEDLPRIDLVLLSHNHYDHMDLPSLSRIGRRWAPPIVTGLGNARTLIPAGIGNVVELDWWDSAVPLPGIAVRYVPAQHWSSRSPVDRRRALWGGHVLTTSAGTLLFAGDTGYGPHVAEIGRRCRPDVALLPIGAYEPRWFMAAQHMNPDEAVRAHVELGAQLSLAIHWGTFQLTDEAIDAPLQALEEAKAARGLPEAAFVAPWPGQAIRWRAGPA